MNETDGLKKRREAAKRERDAFQPLLDEAYQYAIPFRKSAHRDGKGSVRVDQVFDHTAIDSAFRFAGKVQQDFWPAGQDNFSLEPGPIVIDPAEREQVSQQFGLESLTKVAQAFFDDGDWDMAFHEMALELSAGNGAILMNSSDEDDRLWEPISVSIDELLWEAGPNNRISGIFWDRRMSLRMLFDTWPEGKFSQTLRDRFATKPEDEILVHVDTVWERKQKRWTMNVWTKEQETLVFVSQSRTCPWLTPRYFRVPGEVMGRGVVMLAMPTIKTTNTAARLQLMAAAIAMFGIYTAVDDGVFNPDLAPIEPGAFWKVARNGGVLGPSINRFPDPRLDLSNLVLKEMQMGIKATMMDQALPPEAAAVRSATEIMERVKRLAADHLGAYGRLIKEITVPAVKRVLELAYDRGLVPAEVPIDQLLVKVRVKSPLALAREAQRIERIVQWLQMVLMTAAQLGAPQMAMRVAKVETVLADIGRDMGVPSPYIVTADERAQMDQQEAQAAAAAMAMAAATGDAGAVAA